MTYEEFWAKIEITEEEKEKSVHYLKYRGVEEHDHVRQYLESVTGRRVSYSEIATAFRYDKRIRRVLYKYIGLLEESIRAFICNKYGEDFMAIAFTGIMQKQIDIYGELYVSIAELTFGQLIGQAKKLASSDLSELFLHFADKNLCKNLDAIVALRNEVSHNRFLLDNKRLKKCNIGDCNNSLWANILNLRNCLPELFRSRFEKQIEECVEKKEPEFDCQAQWNLVKEIVIEV